jgi:hypothetical protein
VLENLLCVDSRVSNANSVAVANDSGNSAPASISDSSSAVAFSVAKNIALVLPFIEKAQVCASLSLEESVQYDAVKSAILRAYELVPDHYRQRFPNVR